MPFCYSGGVHSISQALDLKNVCSVASVPYIIDSVSSLPQSQFNEGFLKRLSSNQSHTFGEAAIAGFRNDSDNLNLGQLSSFDYLDKIFERGPYNPDLIAAFEEHNGMSRTDETLEEDHAALRIFDLPAGKYRSPSPRTLGEDGLSCRSAVISPSEQLLTLAKSIESCTETIQGKSSSQVPHRTKRIKNLPKQLETQEQSMAYYSEVLSELSDYPLPKKFIELLSKELNLLKQEPIENFGNSLTSEIKNFRTTENMFHKTMLDLKNIEEEINSNYESNISTRNQKAKREALVIELKRLKKKLKQKEQPVFRFSQTLARISDLETVFLQPGRTKEEKNKLLDLLKCEWDEEI